MYSAIKLVLQEMIAQGGRDTDLDLFGRPGGHKTVLNKFTVNKPCLVCGTVIKKEPSWEASSTTAPGARSFNRHLFR